MGCLLKADQVPLRSPVLLPNGMERFIVAACHSNFFAGVRLSALGFAALGAPFAAAIIYPLCPSSLPPSCLQRAAACHASGRSDGPLIPFIPHKTPSLWRRNRPIARSLARGFTSELGSRLPRLGTSQRVRWREADMLPGRKVCVHAKS